MEKYWWIICTFSHMDDKGSRIFSTKGGTPPPHPLNGIGGNLLTPLSGKILKEVLPNHETKETIFFLKRGNRVSRTGGKWVPGAKILMNHKFTHVDDYDALLNLERKELISSLKRGDRASRAAYKLPESEPLRSPSTWGRWHTLRHPG